jgi:predicted MFS family arabinose efflux permease
MAVIEPAAPVTTAATAIADNPPARPSLWHNRDFKLLWAGETVSLFGSQISALAIPLTAEGVLRATATEMGILNAVNFLPFLLFGLLAGVWVDRRRRRPVLMLSNIGRALLLLSIPAAAAIGILSMAQLYVVGFGVGVLTLFFDIAYLAHLPSLIDREDLLEGNSRLELSHSLSQVLGSGIAGILIRLLSAPVTIILDAGSFIFSAVCVRAIAKPEPAPTAATTQRNLRREMGEGVRLILGNPILRAIAGCAGMGNLFGSMGTAILILYMRRSLYMDEGLIGLTLSVGGISALLSALTLKRLTQRVGLGNMIILSSLSFGLIWIFAAIATPAFLPGIFISAILWSITGVYFNINQVSLRQTITPNHLSARMNATMRFFIWGTMPVGSLLGGVLAERFGFHFVFWVAAVGTTLATGFVYYSPLRNIQVMPAPADQKT